MGALSPLLNFTLSVLREPSGLWHTVPVNGTTYDDPVPVFAGTMGAVVNRRCEVGLSSWRPMYDRVRKVNP